MKGITPVVAIVLLMAVTVGAAGTLLTLVQDQQEYVEENAPTIEFDTENLNVESCWYESSADEIRLQVRNDDSETAINTSEVSVYYEFEPATLTNGGNQIVEPQQSFQLYIDNDTAVENPTIELRNNGNTLTHRCFGL